VTACAGGCTTKPSRASRSDTTADGGSRTSRAGTTDSSGDRLSCTTSSAMGSCPITGGASAMPGWGSAGSRRGLQRPRHRSKYRRYVNMNTGTTKTTPITTARTIIPVRNVLLTASAETTTEQHQHRKGANIMHDNLGGRMRTFAGRWIATGFRGGSDGAYLGNVNQANARLVHPSRGLVRSCVGNNRTVARPFPVAAGTTG
jgi:hypothetical protein